MVGGKVPRVIGILNVAYCTATDADIVVAGGGSRAASTHDLAESRPVTVLPRLDQLEVSE